MASGGLQNDLLPLCIYARLSLHIEQVAVQDTKPLAALSTHPTVLRVVYLS